MLSSEFYDVFKKFHCTESNFKGCFSADTIPKKFKLNEFAVINTDIQSGQGKHWYCIFKANRFSLEVFDSLGIDSFKKSFLEKHLKLPALKEIEFNSIPFQKSDTNSCGKYVCYFVINRLHNLDHSLNEILLELFCFSDLDKNEKIVENFFENTITSL